MRRSNSIPLRQRIPKVAYCKQEGKTTVGLTLSAENVAMGIGICCRDLPCGDHASQAAKKVPTQLSNLAVQLSLRQRIVSTRSKSDVMPGQATRTRTLLVRHLWAKSHRRHSSRCVAPTAEVSCYVLATVPFLLSVISATTSSKCRCPVARDATSNILEAHNSPYREENHSRGMGLVLDLLLSRASQLLVDHSAALCVFAAIFPSRLHAPRLHAHSGHASSVFDF